MTINFSGSYIRTASVMGSVTVENMGLGGVTVALSGVSSASTITDDNGQYAFTGLRQGSYSVEISGFDSDEVGFSNTSSAVTVDVGESKIVSFDGTYLRTAGIQGQVSVEGVGLEGVNVSLTGGPDGEDMTTTTDAAGLYSFARLRAGDYAVGISGYDTDEYEFALTSQNVTIALGETATVPFEGILLHTSGIVGRVSVNGMGLEGVTVTASAEGMDDVAAMTDAGGQYAIAALGAGDYTVTISGYDAVEYSFEDSQSVTLALDEIATVNFAGTALRTASISVSVTADGEGVAGAAVTLTMITGATSGTVLGTQATDADGNAAFGPLLAGNYRVDIEVDSDEIDFESTDQIVAVATAEAATASFAGTINRTGRIFGSVTVDGEGMGGVAVMLTGGEEDMSAETGDDGSFEFTGLRKGDYTVSMTNPDENRYTFTSISESVNLAVGQEESVLFAGSMIRSSSISGTVTVEGMGIEGVTVMLSGAASDSTTTDDAGGYAFTSLGAGDYTVAISGYDADAYVFENGTSMDVTVGDNEAATANFDADHAATASVSGMLFIDEATNNDMYDEGENAFAQAGIPVILVGPSVDDQKPSATDETGAFSFTDLVAGTYQLVVAIPDETDLGPYAYGGDPAGYTIELGVGAAHTQNLPFDIAYQTVNFSVMLKSGEETGDALPDAMVTLYADPMGETKIGEGMTATTDDGLAVASIQVARDDTEGPMAYADVTAPDGFGVGGDMQMIEWDPQSPTSVASNSQDVVNLTAEVSFGGATITTAMGGGNALAGWGIDVLMMGDDGEMEAVEGDDVPEMLGGDGMTSFTIMAESAADLPMTYYVTFDADQGEDADGAELDGGESYETVDTVMYTHTGLSVDTEMDGGMITARYTTQTLVVSVYREVDQVPGFTGNIGTGDVSITCIAEDDDDGCVTGVDLELRHETPGNRRNTIDPDVWRWDRSGSDQTVWIDKGVYTFRGLPADYNIFVLADEVGYVEIVPTDNLAAYEDRDANGIEGSAFGSEGGFGHTVMLCPGRAVDPTGQDHGECGSFGFVPTHTVAAHVKKMIVETDNDDGFRAERAINVTGVELGLTPTTGKNIAGEADAITTLESAVRSAGETGSSSTWAREVDEKQDLYFGRMAEGVYGFSLSDDWAAVANGARIGTEFRVHDGAVMDITDRTGADGPFRPADEEGVYIEVRPTTGTLYGIVLDEADDPLEGVEVTVNGVTVETDIDGRYIVPDFSRGASSRGDRAVGAPAGTKLYVSFSKDGYNTQRDDPNHSTARFRYEIADADGAMNGIDFEANDPQRLDIVLEESQMLATITGTVTDKDGDPVSGVDLTVINEAGEDVLHNRQWISSIGAYCSVGEGDAAKNCRRTGDDGTYEMLVRVTEDDEDYTITPSKNRYYFDNTNEVESLEVGDEEDGMDFEALRQSRIRGAVKTAADDGVEGVKVTATARDRTYAPSDETNRNGRFTIWVDGDETYDVMPVSDIYSFENPEDEDNLRLRVDDDETHDIGTFTATSVPSTDNTLSSLTVSPGVLVPATFDPMTTSYAATVGFNVTSTRVAATATSSAATVTIAAGENEETGTGSATMDVELEEGPNTVTITVDPADEDTAEETYTVVVTRSANVPGAPRNLAAVSNNNQALRLTWEPPQNIAGLTGYEFSLNSTDGEDGTWASANAAGSAIDIGASGGSIDLAAADGLINGIAATIWVRSVITAGDGTVTPGGSAPITAAPWPMISMVEFASETIREVAVDGTTDPTMTDTTTVTVTVGAVAYNDFEVMLAFADETQDGLLTFDARATVRRGETTAQILVTAVHDMIDAGAADPMVVLEATMVPAEATDRPAVAAGTGVTITDADVAPSAPENLQLTAGNTTITANWNPPANDAGTATITHYQIRYAASTADFTGGASDVGWETAAGVVEVEGTGGTGTTYTITGLTNGTTYIVQVRAVSSAGGGAGSNAPTETPSSS